MTTLTARPNTKSKLEALKAFMMALEIKFEETQDPYNPEFVAKIQESEKQFKEGQFIELTKDDFWK